MTVQPRPGRALERSQENSLADVVNTILDKGVVIDVFARVSVVGIEVLRIDARVVVASIDTYLRWAERVNRLELGAEEPNDLAGVVGEVSEAASRGVSKGKSKGALDGIAEKIGDVLTPDEPQTAKR